MALDGVEAAGRGDRLLNMNRFDYVIVGAGGAGCVLAERLSSQAGTRVLLIEAGMDIVPGREPADVLNVFPLSTFNDAYAWRDLRAYWRRADNDSAAPFQQGRVVGGGSTVMGMWAVRGTPADYDGWRDAGAAGWGWQDVLPYFRRIEADIDFDGPLHGNAGRIPVRRQRRPEQWSALARAMSKVAADRGWRHIDDMNGDFGDGHCLLPISRYEGSRASAGRCYLDAAVRTRPNLALWSQTTVIALRRRERRITGVTVRRADGSTIEVDAGETLLAAGAVYSPAILLRAGIGPGAALQAAGIKVLADRPGVGSNLQNHPLLPAVALLNGRVRDPAGWQPPAATYLRWSSGQEGCPAADMGLYIRSYLAWHALGRRMAMLAPVLMKPFSSGKVSLESGDPLCSPRVEFNFWSDPRDLPRMANAFRWTAGLFGTHQIRALCDEPFVLLNAGRLGKLNRLSTWNAIQGWVGARALSIAPAVTKALLRRIAEMRPLAELVADEQLLMSYVQEHTIGTNHVCGTCRMGAPSDPLAVVDIHGAVLGVDGLRVMDASIMPTVPSGNTHMPTVMLAEKLADGLMARPATTLSA